MNRLTPRKLVWQICVALLLILLNAPPAASQDKRAKVRISNAGLTITALPLLAAQRLGNVFNANGLDVELIVMSPSLAAAAMAQGDIDYVAGVGPASVAATFSGLPSRAIWFSSDRISYWLQARAAVQNAAGSQRQKDRPLRRRGRYQPCGVDRLPWRSRARTRKTTRWSAYRDSRCRSITRSNPALSTPR